MAAVSLVKLGMSHKMGDVPALKLLRKVRIYGTGDTQGYTGEVEISAASATAVFSVPANTLVTRISARRRKNFANATTAVVTFTIGDTNDVDGWFTATQIGLTTVAGIQTGEAGGAYKYGKLYSAAQNINVVPSAAVTKGGYMELMIEYVLMGGILADE